VNFAFAGDHVSVVFSGVDITHVVPGKSLAVADSYSLVSFNDLFKCFW